MCEKEDCRERSMKVNDLFFKLGWLFRKAETPFKNNGSTTVCIRNNYCSHLEVHYWGLVFYCPTLEVLA